MYFINFHTIRLDIVGLDGSLTSSEISCAVLAASLTSSEASFVDLVALLTSSGISCVVLVALEVNGCEGLGGGGL